MSSSDFPHLNWRLLLWFLTVQWRWSAAQQRELLAWWQAVGWEGGWTALLHREPRWQAAQAWLRHHPTGPPPEQWYWVSLFDAEFPDALRTCPAAPTVLWSNLPWERWSGPVLAVVGSRRCSAYGRLAVTQLVPDFALQHNALVVSGGAFGIDQAAHEAALAVGQPTWIVLGCGLNHLPSTLQQYAQPPARFVSPFPPADHAEKWRFPARNRVMAQLAHGVLIIEAAAKSGSLITAAAALEFGKEVLVVLPPFTSPNAAGAQRLLQQGAVPVSTPNDIARALQLTPSATAPAAPVARSAHEQLVVNYLRAHGGSGRWTSVIESIMKDSRLERSAVQSLLTTLELRGSIEVELGMIRLSGMIQS